MSTETYEVIKPVRTQATEMAEAIASSQAHDSGASQGFKNVNQQWLKKTISFDEGIELLTKGKAETEDLHLPMDAVSFEESSGKLGVNLDGYIVFPTKHALAQLGSRLDIPTKILVNWYDTGDSEDIQTVVKILNNGKRKYLNEETSKKEDEEDSVSQKFLWRTRKNGSLRATLSNKFARLDNQWFLEAMAKIIPDGRLSHWKGDSDTIYGNILVPDSIRVEKDSEYGGGCSVGNSEIGQRCLCSHPWLVRWICFNGSLWDNVKGVSYTRKHLGVKINYEKQFENLSLNVKRQIPLISANIDALLNSRTFTWSDTSRKMLAQATYELGLTKKQGAMLLEAYEIEPELSCFGLINAITRASQNMPNDVWLACDSFAAMLTSESVWNSYSAKAKALTSKDVESCFATVQ